MVEIRGQELKEEEDKGSGREPTDGSPHAWGVIDRRIREAPGDGDGAEEGTNEIWEANVCM